VVEAAGPNLVVRPLRKVQVKGKSREFMIYELLGLRDSTDPELCAGAEDMELCSLTWEASRHFQNGNFAEASRCYSLTLHAFPNDTVARILLAECTQLLQA
jgi:adenylate cyclase